MQPGVREHWGLLEVFLDGRSLVARLRHMNGRSVEMLPPLYDVHLVPLCDDVLELRGFEKAIGWHLQVWSCRRPTTHEIALAGKCHEALDRDYLRHDFRCKVYISRSIIESEQGNVSATRGPQ